MIKKIKTIKNFGVYIDFKWDQQSRISDFKEKNIIYGWNYSGKTTFSRIFSSLKNKKIHSKFSQGEFTVVTSERKEFQERQLQEFPYNVEVFNSEYVRDNFKWDTNENLNSIAFDVGENVKLRKNLKTNETKLRRINGFEKTSGLKTSFNNSLLAYEELDGKFTAEAKIIKLEFNSLIDFTKSNFKNVRDLVIDDLDEFVIEDAVELVSVKKMALAKNDKLKLGIVVLNLELKSLLAKISQELSEVPPSSEIISVLEDDREKYTWAKNGLNIHRNLNECSFCGNLIQSSRVEALVNYFNNAASKTRDRINDLISEVETESYKLKNINIPRSKNDFTDKCQISFEEKLSELPQLTVAYEKELVKLKSALNDKINGNLFIKKEPPEIDFLAFDLLEMWVLNLNNIITEHNLAVSSFVAEQENARDRFKKHLVSSFLKRENYKKIDSARTRAEKYLGILSRIEVGIMKDNERIQGELKSVAAGKESLNNYIKTLLGRDDVNIVLTHDDKFSLKRGDFFAENLSEGEKTAISFAYFLVSLESLHKDRKLEDTIVFIDDPISSLDANHIAHVYSLINHFFFRKESKGESVETKNCFKQLFISTHNFEFFSFLKDSSPINKKPGCEYFFIKRITKTASCIGPLPASLRSKSEYILLFELIYKFHKDGASLDDDKYILIPNALRRFMELYTLIKLPGNNSEIDFRLNKLMDGPSQLKALHHFSHMTSFEKLAKHDELVLLLPDAVREMLEILKKDESHYNSLLESINIKQSGV